MFQNFEIHEGKGEGQFRKETLVTPVKSGQPTAEWRDCVSVGIIQV